MSDFLADVSISDEVVKYVGGGVPMVSHVVRNVDFNEVE